MNGKLFQVYGSVWIFVLRVSKCYSCENSSKVINFFFLKYKEKINIEIFFGMLKMYTMSIAKVMQTWKQA